MARAENDPRAVTYSFLGGFSSSGEQWREREVANEELLRDAGALAVRIRRTARRGDRVVLLNRPGYAYLVGLYACLLAGVIAVPAYPPEKARAERAMGRIQAILADARPCVALVDDDTELVTSLDDLDVVVSTEVDPEETTPHLPSPEDIAVLQYTSGSTATPKGVVLTHGNLVRNLTAGRAAFGLAGRMDGVFWLPPYHDMGLIGGIFMALFCGGRSRVMTPVAFLRDPLRWMRALSRYNSYASAAPDFAYALCVEAAEQRPDVVAELDLSAWGVAISGAEPVRASTLDRFARALAPAGFRREAFFPAYGLAESTLLVTTRPGGTSVRRLDAARDVVGCGHGADPAQQVAVVDPVRRTRCADGAVGEIWVSGPSVASGYWDRAAESAATFEATIVDGGGDLFLRTGDLGFLGDGELFVTGRVKDLIVLRGRNYYPQDIEQTAEQAHPALRGGRCAAFSVDNSGEEELVVAVEPRSRVDQHEVASAVRVAVGDEHQVSVREIVFLPRGGIHRTSSGKLRRSAVRADYLAGVHPRETKAAKNYVAPRDEAERVVAKAWERVLGVDRVGVHDRFFEMGGDSIKAARLVAELNDANGYELSLTEIAQAHTVEEFARLVQAREADGIARIDLG